MKSTRGRGFVAALGGAAITAVALLANVTSEGGGAVLFPEAEAFAAGAATASPFVARARRGEVAPPDVSEVEQLCALLTSCDGLPIPPNLIPGDFSACVRQMSQDLTSASAVNFSLTLRECGLAANSCEQLRTCALRGAKHDACQGRGARNPVGYCDADGRALTCWHDHIIAVRDCPRADEQCVVQQGQSMCILGPCPTEIKEGDPEQCSASGARILQCEHGKLQSLDCGAFGLRCTSTPGEQRPVGCATSGPACTSGSRRCEGNVAVACHNGHEVRVDCAAGGLVCNSTPGSTPVGACVAPPPPSNGTCPPNETPTCGGAGNAYINYCFAGKQRSYFCKPLFSGCTSDRNGVRCVR